METSNNTVTSQDHHSSGDNVAGNKQTIFTQIVVALEDFARATLPLHHKSSATAHQDSRSMWEIVEEAKNLYSQLANTYLLKDQEPIMERIQELRKEIEWLIQLRERLVMDRFLILKNSDPKEIFSEYTARWDTRNSPLLVSKEIFLEYIIRDSENYILIAPPKVEGVRLNLDGLESLISERAQDSFLTEDIKLVSCKKAFKYPIEPLEAESFKGLIVAAQKTAMLVRCTIFHSVVSLNLIFIGEDYEGKLGNFQMEWNWNEDDYFHTLESEDEKSAYVMNNIILLHEFFWCLFTDLCFLSVCTDFTPKIYSFLETRGQPSELLSQIEVISSLIESVRSLHESKQAALNKFYSVQQQYLAKQEAERKLHEQASQEGQGVIGGIILAAVLAAATLLVSKCSSDSEIMAAKNEEAMCLGTKTAASKIIISQAMAKARGVEVRPYPHIKIDNMAHFDDGTSVDIFRPSTKGNFLEVQGVSRDGLKTCGWIGKQWVSK